MIYSESNIAAINKSTTLFITKIFPSLFPFFVAINLLIHTNLIATLDKHLSYIMINVFNVPGSGSLPFIMGLLSGYPTGAKIISEYRKNNICSKTDCERLLAYTNNSSPLFIVGSVGTSMFLNKNIGFLLLFIHMLSTITVAIIFRFYKYNEKRNSSTYNEIVFSNISQILSDAIMNSIKTLVIILGYIILFSLIINIIIESNLLTLLNNLPNSDLFKATLLGSLEITSGINALSIIKVKTLYYPIILTSFLLGLGGFSVFMQIYSIISQTDLSIKPYIVGKLMQAIFSVMYIIIFLNVFTSFNFAI